MTNNIQEFILVTPTLASEQIYHMQCSHILAFDLVLLSNSNIQINMNSNKHYIALIDICCISDLCCLPRTSLSNKDKALVTGDDITEVFLVLPHWKL